MRGGGRNAFGQLFTFEPPASAAQARIDSAIMHDWIDPTTGVRTGFSPQDAVYALEFPKATTIYLGPTGYQQGVQVGGVDRIQVFIPEPWKIPGVTVISESELP